MRTSTVLAIAAIAAVGLLALVGATLSRVDQLAAQDRATAAELRLLEAKLELARAELLVVHRDVTPPNDPRLEILVRRTDALRGAVFALVRTGKVSMPGNPGGDWIVWPLELAEVPR